MEPGQAAAADLPALSRKLKVTDLAPAAHAEAGGELCVSVKIACASERVQACVRRRVGVCEG